MELSPPLEPGLARVPGRWAMAAPIACGCAVAGLAAVVAFGDPSGSGLHLPACPLREMTGLWCPGCGMTRATNAVLRADFAAAFGYNLFFPLFLGAIVVGWFAWLRRALGRAPVIAFSRTPMWIPIALGVTLILFGVIRNMPGFEALAP